MSTRTLIPPTGSSYFSGVQIGLDPVESPPPDLEDVSQRLDAELRRISALTDELRKSVSFDPEPERIQEPKSFIATQPEPSNQQLKELAEVAQRVKHVKRDARDAWCAVVLMGLFIVCGIVWSFDRIGKQDEKIEELTLLLEAEKSAAIARVTTMQQLQIEIAGMKRAQPKGLPNIETVRLSTDE